MEEVVKDEEVMVDRAMTVEAVMVVAEAMAVVEEAARKAVPKAEGAKEAVKEVVTAETEVAETEAEAC